MKNIEVQILNPDAIYDSEKMMVAMARLTQRGHSIKNMNDFMNLIEKGYKEDTAKTMCQLPHPTIQKFGTINIAIVGASRRFLAQITRHQNEVKFMSGSLQYSDYSDDAQFCVPYEITEADTKSNSAVICATDNYYTDKYISGCKRDLKEYAELAEIVGRDAAGYKMPQGMRNVLLISATPYQWKHMISQRSCNRNTLETQYVMLRCWEELTQHSMMFDDCGPACTDHSKAGFCPEGHMCCGNIPHYKNATEFLNGKFPLIRSEEQCL